MNFGDRVETKCLFFDFECMSQNSQDARFFFLLFCSCGASSGPVLGHNNANKGCTDKENSVWSSERVEEEERKSERERGAWTCFDFSS